MFADKLIEGATAAEDEPEVPKRAEAGLTGWIDCYPKCELKGTLFCGGVDGPPHLGGVEAQHLRKKRMFERSGQHLRQVLHWKVEKNIALV